MSFNFNAISNFLHAIVKVFIAIFSYPYIFVKNLAGKNISISIAKNSFFSLFVTIIAQSLCGKFLENIANEDVNNTLPTLFIIDSFLIFLGNYQAVFVINLLNINNLYTPYNDKKRQNYFIKKAKDFMNKIRCTRETKKEMDKPPAILKEPNIEDKQDRIEKGKPYILRNKSYDSLLQIDRNERRSNQFTTDVFFCFLTLIIQCFRVSLIITIVSSFIRIFMYKDKTEVLLFFLNTYTSILLASILSSIITLFLLLVVLIFCRLINLNLDNILLPIITSVNEILSIILMYICYRRFLYNKLLFSSIFTITSVFFYGLLIFLSKKLLNKKSDKDKVSKLPISIIVAAYTFSLSSSYILEYFSYDYPQVASIGIIYCGLLASVSMIYISNLCTVINQYYLKNHLNIEFKTILKYSIKKIQRGYNGLMVLTMFFFSLYLMFTKTYKNVYLSLGLFVGTLVSLILFPLIIKYTFIIENCLNSKKNNRSTNNCVKMNIGGISLVLIVAIIENIGFFAIIFIIIKLL